MSQLAKLIRQTPYAMIYLALIWPKTACQLSSTPQLHWLLGARMP